MSKLLTEAQIIEVQELLKPRATTARWLVEELATEDGCHSNNLTWSSYQLVARAAGLLGFYCDVQVRPHPREGNTTTSQWHVLRSQATDEGRQIRIALAGYNPSSSWERYNFTSLFSEDGPDELATELGSAGVIVFIRILGAVGSLQAAISAAKDATHTKGN